MRDPKPISCKSKYRRDIFFYIAGESGITASKIRERLEDDYETRFSNRTIIYRNVDDLVDSGLVEKRSEAVENKLFLTEKGEERLDEHLEWLASVL